MDRFSNLPDEIICHIVSFLSAKEAAFTTVLSKNFQNLFTIIPNLRFSDMPSSQGNFIDFLDEVLALPSSSRIRDFSLKSSTIDPIHYAHVNRCLCDVLKRGVMKVELDIHVGRQYSLPSEVFTCKTIVKLKLGVYFVIDILPRNASLPALETLALDSVQFKDLRGCAFEAFLSACPVLKELIIHGMEWECWKWSGNLSSPTLQRLTIHHAEVDQSKIPPTRITLDAPSLVYLDCSDVVPDEYTSVHLDSLVEANLELMLGVDHYCDGGYVHDYENISGNPTNLIKGLRNVEIMNLSYINTFQVFYHFRKAIPVFEKLYHLTITPHNDLFSCQKFLPFLVKKCPNLETLVIHGSLHLNEEEPESICDCMAGYSFLLSCPVKVLVITEYNGTSGEVEQLKHFLEKLSCLEVVKLCCPAGGRYDDETLMLPRVSTKCKIEVTIS